MEKVYVPISIDTGGFTYIRVERGETHYSYRNIKGGFVRVPRCQSSDYLFDCKKLSELWLLLNGDKNE